MCATYLRFVVSTSKPNKELYLNRIVMNIYSFSPPLLFPAISLVMLAYTNRFLAVAALIRSLHVNYKANEKDVELTRQIGYLKVRLRLIQSMQFLGISSFIGALLSMFLMYVKYTEYALVSFAVSVLLITASLVISLLEIWQSTKALEVALSDMRDE
jgi:type III secretory pathway component EscS